MILPRSQPATARKLLTISDLFPAKAPTTPQNDRALALYQDLARFLVAGLYLHRDHCRFALVEHLAETDVIAERARGGKRALWETKVLFSVQELGGVKIGHKRVECETAARAELGNDTECGERLRWG